MATIMPEGIRVPTGTDSYDLTNDLRKMMESAFTIVPVANTAERGALVAELVAAGRGPTAARPLYVDRADATPTARLEVTYSGSAWAPIQSGDTGWVPCASPSAFNASNLFLRKIGSVVHVRGNVVPTASGSFTTSYVAIAFLPAAFRQSTYVNQLHPGQSNTAYPVAFQINPTGGLIAARVGSGTGAYTTNTQIAPTGWVDAD